MGFPTGGSGSAGRIQCVECRRPALSLPLEHFRLSDCNVCHFSTRTWVILIHLTGPPYFFQLITGKRRENVESITACWTKHIEFGGLCGLYPLMSQSIYISFFIFHSSISNWFIFECIPAHNPFRSRSHLNNSRLPVSQKECVIVYSGFFVPPTPIWCN